VVPNHSNYRGIYCEECDFHGGIFPRDADFTGAVLDRSDFSSAALKGAVFDNAELLGTKFVEADLEDSTFRSLDESLIAGTESNGGRVLLGRTRYLDHIASGLDLNPMINVAMPNFSCANLSNVNFDHHSLFPGVISLRRSFAKSDRDKSGWYQHVSSLMKDDAQARPKVEFLAIRVTPPKFFKADISGVHFERTRFFTFTESSNPFSDFMSGSGVTVGNIGIEQGEMEAEAFRLEVEGDRARRGPPLPDVPAFQRHLKAAFYSVQLDSASLPQSVKEFLRRSAPQESDLRSVFRMPFGAGADPDLQCTPRRG
jgi:uncharacterized protein YjbI with pentapeptide repeats